MLSAQTDVFGVGTTVTVGSRLVVASSVASGWIVPGGGPPEYPASRASMRRCWSGDLPAKSCIGWSTGCRPAAPAIWFRSCCAMMDVGMVPKAVDEIIMADGVIAFVPRAMDVEPCLMRSIVSVRAERRWKAEAAPALSAAARTVSVVPKISVRNDVAGCADNDRMARVQLAVVDAEDLSLRPAPSMARKPREWSRCAANCRHGSNWHRRRSRRDLSYWRSAGHERPRSRRGRKPTAPAPASCRECPAGLPPRTDSGH